jgi:hypothetical protein
MAGRALSGFVGAVFVKAYTQFAGRTTTCGPGRIAAVARFARSEPTEHAGFKIAASAGEAEKMPRAAAASPAELMRLTKSRFMVTDFLS